MAIRFFCKGCNQLLGIARRKAGRKIACPKCGFSQTVPSEEAAAAAFAMSRLGRSPEPVDEASTLVVYEDEPAAAELPGQAEAEGPPAAPPPEPDAIAPPPEPEAQAPVPRGMILFHRHTLYVQAVLFVLVGLVAFGSGYFIGRGDANFEEQVRFEQAQKQPMLIEGKLVYRPAVGKVSGDEGAIAIVLPVLPEGKGPETKIRVQSIRPQDAPPPSSDANLHAIEKLGGAYARANDSGSFFMEIPQKGTYRLLLVARHALRPAGSEIEELDLDEIGSYFTSPRDLIGRCKYRWVREEFNPGHKPIEHDFGLDGTN